MEKTPGRDVEVFWVYLYQGFKAREYNNGGDRESAPHRRRDCIYKGVPPTLFLEELLFLCFGIFPIQILLLKDVHQQEEH